MACAKGYALAVTWARAAVLLWVATLAACAAAQSANAGQPPTTTLPNPVPAQQWGTTIAMARRGTALVVGSGTTVQTLYTYEQQQGDWVQVGGALDTGGTVSIDLSTDGLILVVGHDVLASVLSRKPNSAVTVYWRDSVSVPFTPANSTGVAPEALPRRDEALNRALNWGFQQYIVKISGDGITILVSCFTGQTDGIKTSGVLAAMYDLDRRFKQPTTQGFSDPVGTPAELVAFGTITAITEDAEDFYVRCDDKAAVCEFNYNGTSDSWEFTGQKLTLPPVEKGGKRGIVTSLACNADASVLLVGSTSYTYYPTEGENKFPREQAGCVFVYRRLPDGTFGAPQQLFSPDPRDKGRVGWQVKLDGTVGAVSEEWMDPDKADTFVGRIWVLNVPQNGDASFSKTAINDPSETVAVISPQTKYSNFGHEFSVARNTELGTTLLAASAPAARKNNRTTGARILGGAYVYDLKL